MKIMMMVLTFVFCTITAQPEVLADGEIRSEFSRFKDSRSFMRSYISQAIEAGNDRFRFKTSFDLRISAPDIYTDLCLLNNCANSGILLKKANFILNRGMFSFALGKQIHASEIEFDSIDFHPSAARDFSEPFSGMKNEKRLGVWGISLKMGRRINHEFLVAKKAVPILATQKENPWTLSLPIGFSYESPNDHGLNLNWRIFGPLFDEGGRWEIIAFSGYSNAVDHMKMNLESRTFAPVFAREKSVGVLTEFPLGMFTSRVGGVYHWQENADDFVSYALEVEWFGEDIVQGGDNLFLEAGYADVKEVQRAVLSNPGIDMRRIYEGGTVLAVLEYEAGEILFKSALVCNIDKEGFYFSPEVIWSLELEESQFELGLRVEKIDSGSNKDDVFSLNQENDRIMITMSWSL